MCYIGYNVRMRKLYFYFQNESAETRQYLFSTVETFAFDTFLK